MTAKNRTTLKALFITGDTASEFDFIDLVDSGYNLNDDGGLVAIYNANSTGLLTGGGLSINGGDNTKFDLAAGVGRIVDNFTDPENPTYTLVSWSAQTAVTVTNLATQPRSFIAVNSAGTIVQSGTPYSNADHKDKIIIGNLGHANFTNLVAFANVPDASFDAGARVGDLARAIGPLNVSGNIYGANGVNLNIDKNAGSTYRFGTNFHTNKADPDLTTDAADTSLFFRYSHRDGAGGFNLGGPTNAIDATNYDNDSGSPVAVTAGYWTVQRIIYIAAPDETRIEYGQTEYASKQAAIDAAVSASHEANPAFLDGIVRAFLVVKQGTTDLSSADNVFIEGAKFGASGGGVFATATVSLQSAYNNSGEPEITTTVTRPHLSVREGAGVGGTPLLIENSAGATLFSVGVDGVASAASTFNAPNMIAEQINASNISVSTLTVGGSFSAPGMVDLADLATDSVDKSKIKTDSVGSDELIASTLSRLYNGVGAQRWEISASGHLIPSLATQDIGSSALPIRSLYMSGSTLFMDGIAVIYASAGNIVFNPDKFAPTATIAVTGSNIGANEINEIHLAANSVGASEIKANSISQSELIETYALNASLIDLASTVSTHIGSSGASHAVATTVGNGFMSATDKLKLNGIEAGATADQSNAEIKIAYEANANTNEFSDAEQSKLAGIESGATGDQSASEILAAMLTVDGAGSGLEADLLDAQHGAFYRNAANLDAGILPAARFDNTAHGNRSGGNLHSLATISTHGFMSSSDKSKIDGIESGATADQTGAEIKSAYEAEANTNAFTDAEKTNLTGLVASALTASDKAVANGLATLDSGGKVPTAQLPPLAITDTFVEASEVNMLALTAQVGDVCVRSDLERSYILTASPASVLGNWQELLSAGGADVLSVNSQTGAVVLTTSHISEGSNLYYTESRVTNNVTVAAHTSKLAGIESGATADQTASEILTLIKTVDGAGSGLDADLLDGISSGAYMRSNVNDQFTASVLTVNNNSRLAIGQNQFRADIFHDSAKLYVETYTGAVEFKNRVSGANEIMARFNPNGSSELWYNNSQKLVTSNTGATLFGSLAPTDGILPVTDNNSSIGSAVKRFSNVYAVTFQGEATSARFADLAERYEADKAYEPGTVVVIGGEKEITECTKYNEETTFGIISTNPAFMMNSEAGEDDTHPYVALMGRVPCKVVGPIRKGQKLVTSTTPGHAMAAEPGQVGGIIAMALENHENEGAGVIEVTVFRG